MPPVNQSSVAMFSQMYMNTSPLFKVLLTVGGFGRCPFSPAAMEDNKIFVSHIFPLALIVHYLFCFCSLNETRIHGFRFNASLWGHWRQGGHRPSTLWPLDYEGTISPAMVAIFASLNKRTNLKVLFLNPDQMGALFRLSSNHIKGATPLNITTCSELKIHALTGNEISRAIPIRSSAVSKNLEDTFHLSSH